MCVKKNLTARAGLFEKSNLDLEVGELRLNGIFAGLTLPPTLSSWLVLVLYEAISFGLNGSNLIGRR